MKDNNFPQCFGALDTVFPMGHDGLRSSPEPCMSCPHKTECLKSAILTKEGFKVKDEFIDRAYESGMMRFMERWSKKKHLNRMIKTKGNS